MNSGNYYKIILSTLLFLLILIFCFNCAAPYRYQTTPFFEERIDNIKSIALYPLIFSDEGEESYRFGYIFNKEFLNSINTNSYIKPINFINPDSTVKYLN